jgi:Uma2 family endonuclease
VGEKDHSKLQTQLTLLLGTRAAELGIYFFVEQRVQVKATRFRVPDLCVVSGPEPEDQIFTSPPLVCVETLSKDDRMPAMLERIDDYLSFGVRHVWVIDPRGRKGYDYTSSGMHEVTHLQTEQPPIVIPIEALFEEA